MNKKKTRKELSDLCREYLEQKELFRWFIVKYFGLRKYIELWELAEDDQEKLLRDELNRIWYELPDSLFNIRVAPPGWKSFIRLIEE